MSEQPSIQKCMDVATDCVLELAEALHVDGTALSALLWAARAKAHRLHRDLQILCDERNLLDDSTEG